ncbi:MAG TPA: hypothetical protein VFO34_03615 [Candidatus Acidoferrales bacterium]|nr:hypothetical protein [Candidatus Acidoferrales bacterium]
MKKPAAILSALSLLACAALARQSGTQKPPDTYNGEIFDTQCAEQASHEAMEDTRQLPKDAKQCVLFCVKNGARLVLYDSGNRISYALDDQAKALEFAGRQVQITGTLDTFTNTLHVVHVAGVQ